MTLAAAAPDRANAMIRDLADAGTLTRADLDGLLGARLTEPDRVALTAPNTPPDRLVELLGSTGAVGPATVVAVLHHEGVEAATVAGLIPAIGLPIPDAVRELHDRWGMDRLSAGAHLAATPDDLRASRMHDRRDAPSRTPRGAATARHPHPHLGAGRPHPARGRHVSGRSGPPARPPRPDPRHVRRRRLRDPTGPGQRLPVAVREASVPDLVALSERYGLSPAETAETLSTACATPATLVHVVHGRCDGDMPATLEACAAVLPPGDVADELGRDPVVTSLAAARTAATSTSSSSCATTWAPRARARHSTSPPMTV